MADASEEKGEQWQWMAAENLADHLVPLLKHHDVKWRGHGIIYIDHQHDNICIAQQLLVDLSISLGAPISLVRSRLVELGWLKDIRSALPIQNNVRRGVESLAPWALDSDEEDEEDDPDMSEDHDRD
ncbi:MULTISPECIES: hypothetical protein [unclassified Pseudomonas]|uniref:hypothetical protein n=1 Tax=unclassified Pseudomonas TaxID=196821 RepID=UPI0015A3E48F|nr:MULTISPECIES: hypothetical protein [unclassified Pseudomonas]NWC92246.1 hypothetical protein [Pseudomonas sp. IPO3779]NWD20188.1 hypothetical protein [Pseudomonas sp. IPO3778]